MCWLFKFCFISFMSLLLTGCQEEVSYNYLMKHPFYTSKQLQRCESASEAKKRGTFCMQVREAAENLTAILKEQQMDPQGFGALLLETQTNADEIKTHLRQARSITVTEAEQEKHRKEIEKLESLLRLQQEKIQILLAVISMTRPE